MGKIFKICCLAVLTVIATHAVIALVIYPFTIASWRVRGKVVDAKTKKPIEGAYINYVRYYFWPWGDDDALHIKSKCPNTFRQTFTNGSGKFRISRDAYIGSPVCSTDSYGLSIYKPGYHKQIFRVSSNPWHNAWNSCVCYSKLPETIELVPYDEKYDPCKGWEHLSNYDPHEKLENLKATKCEIKGFWNISYNKSCREINNALEEAHSRMLDDPCYQGFELVSLTEDNSAIHKIQEIKSHLEQHPEDGGPDSDQENIISEAEKENAERMQKIKSILEQYPNLVNYQKGYYPKSDWAALHWAAWNLDLELCKYLISKGADVNLQDNFDLDTPLFKALKQDNHQSIRNEIVKLFLDSGARLDIANNDRMTPLFFPACGKCSEDVELVKLFIEKGAYINVKPKGFGTPFLTAISCGSKDVIEILLAHGADINATSGGGWTPLHEAAVHSTPEIIEMLIKNGAKINVRADSCGGAKTPLGFATTKENKELLIKYGAIE